MGMNGTIMIFPTAGAPPENLNAKAHDLIECFERLGLFEPGTAANCEGPNPWRSRFDWLNDRGEILAEDYASIIVKAERIQPEMAEFVNLLTPEDIGMEDQKYEFPGQFALPNIEFSVLRKPHSIIRGVDGEQLANTWATIEFTYEAVPFMPEFHQILAPNHPLFAELAKTLGSPVACDLDIG